MEMPPWKTQAMRTRVGLGPCDPRNSPSNCISKAIGKGQSSNRFVEAARLSSIVRKIVASNPTSAAGRDLSPGYSVQWHTQAHRTAQQSDPKHEVVVRSDLPVTAELLHRLVGSAWMDKESRHVMDRMGSHTYGSNNTDVTEFRPVLQRYQICIDSIYAQRADLRWQITQLQVKDWDAIARREHDAVLDPWCY